MFCFLANHYAEGALVLVLGLCMQESNIQFRTYLMTLLNSLSVLRFLHGAKLQTILRRIITSIFINLISSSLFFISMSPFRIIESMKERESGIKPLTMIKQIKQHRNNSICRLRYNIIALLFAIVGKSEKS